MEDTPIRSPRTTLLLLSAALVACASQPRIGSGGPPALAFATPPADPPIVCSKTCAPGSACQLTKTGPACANCAPGSVPTCKDDRFVATCDADGTLKPTIDCFAKNKHCASGTCMSRECQPNAVHCFEGDVYRCSARGTARTLMTNCRGEDDASFKGVCQEGRGTPACRIDCKVPDGSIVALYDCEPCNWDASPFCATQSNARACGDTICHNGMLGAGGVAIPCWRETDGLVVPSSERREQCRGAGPVGDRTITYQVCRDGTAVAASRVEPCSPPSE